MNIYQCDAIKFSYIDAQHESVNNYLLNKVKEDGKYSLHPFEESIDSMFDKKNSATPQVYKSDAALKAVFFPCPFTTGTIMISNIIDGWETLCFQMSEGIGVNVFVFRFDVSKDECAMNSLLYMENGNAKRVIYAMKDPKWKFFQMGAPLWFENEDFYKEKTIAKRINKSIIIDYCKKLNVMIDDENFCGVKKEASLFQMHLSVIGSKTSI